MFFLVRALILSSLIHARILLSMSTIQSDFFISSYYDLQKQFKFEFIKVFTVSVLSSCSKFTRSYFSKV